MSKSIGVEPNELRKWVNRNPGALVSLEFSTDGVNWTRTTGQVGLDPTGTPCFLQEGGSSPFPFPPAGVYCKCLRRLDDTSRASTPTAKTSSTFTEEGTADAFAELQRSLLKKHDVAEAQRTTLLKKHEDGEVQRKELLRKHEEGDRQRDVLLQMQQQLASSQKVAEDDAKAQRLSIFSALDDLRSQVASRAVSPCAESQQLDAIQSQLDAQRKVSAQQMQHLQQLSDCFGRLEAGTKHAPIDVDLFASPAFQALSQQQTQLQQSQQQQQQQFQTFHQQQQTFQQQQIQQQAIQQQQIQQMIAFQKAHAPIDVDALSQAISQSVANSQTRRSPSPYPPVLQSGRTTTSGDLGTRSNPFTLPSQSTSPTMPLLPPNDDTARLARTLEKREARDREVISTHELTFDECFTEATKAVLLQLPEYRIAKDHPRLRELKGTLSVVADHAATAMHLGISGMLALMTTRLIETQRYITPQMMVEIITMGNIVSPQSIAAIAEIMLVADRDVKRIHITDLRMARITRAVGIIGQPAAISAMYEGKTDIRAHGMPRLRVRFGKESTAGF